MPKSDKGDSKGKAAKSGHKANTGAASDKGGGFSAIYALCDPDTGEVRYIGKANNAEKRLKGHIRDAKRRDTPVYFWIRKLLANDKQPTMKVLEHAQDWKEAERRLIAQYRETHRLLNVAEGGDEPHCPYEVRAANGRKAAVSRTATPLKKKLYTAKHMLGIALKQGHVSEATKAKMRELARRMPGLCGEWATI